MPAAAPAAATQTIHMGRESSPFEEVATIAHIIDLDAAKAARMEAEQEPKVIRFGGVDFDLPVEMPYRTADHWRVGEITEGLKLLLGSRWDEFDALAPSSLDLNELASGLSMAYGFGGPGESPASVDSSGNGSRRSRRTSSGSTG